MPESASANTTQHCSRKLASRSRVSKRHPLHPEDVSLSPAWLQASAAGSLFGLGVLWRFGWPGLVGLAGAGTLLAGYATVVEPRRPVLERLELAFPNLPPELDGLRIGQIADCHLGLPFTANNVRWAVKQMQHEQPDLLVFTGDFVHRPAGLARLPELLHGVKAPLGMFAVPGNHDYWEGVMTLKQTLQSLGINVLMNERRALDWRGGPFWLLGTDDVWNGRPDLAATLRGVPNDAFKVLLAHTPHGAPQAAAAGIDLQISGHTHGGHMVLPLLGPIAKPRYTDDFLSGVFQVDATTLYVSRGLGGVPLRLFCPPEIAVITLRRGV